jgi:nucleoside-diphosphate-sugar epimerase
MSVRRAQNFPARIENVAQLEELLSRPTPGVIETFRKLDGDLLLLGVAGKMGPTIARMARRAADAAGTKQRIIGVARFTDPRHEGELQAHGIETIRADLLDEAALAALPDAKNILYLAGMKFGATGQEARTWAMNTHLPALVCRRFPRSRIVAFSTGNVYGLTPLAGRGSRETDTLAPVGEYAMSCLGRERMFEHFSRALGTPVAIIRLNYACDLRYGVLVDLAAKVRRGEAVDLRMAAFNTIWQGDANAITLQAFAHVSTPPWILNLTGPETVRVRDACEFFGKAFRRTPRFTGRPATTALLSDARKSFAAFGRPQVGAKRLMSWVADWISRDRATLGKPTHFENREGKF